MKILGCLVGIALLPLTATAQTSPAKSLQLQIATYHRSFPQHQSVTLMLTAQNVGEGPIYIPSILDPMESPEGGVELRVLDEKGSKVGLASMIVDEDPSFINSGNWQQRLESGWLLLYPGYSYSHRLNLNPREHWFPDKAGRYKVSAILRSHFTLSSSWLAVPRLAGAPELPKSRYPILDGEIISNEIEITIKNR